MYKLKDPESNGVLFWAVGLIVCRIVIRTFRFCFKAGKTRSHEKRNHEDHAGYDGRSDCHGRVRCDFKSRSESPLDSLQLGDHVSERKTAGLSPKWLRCRFGLDLDGAVGWELLSWAKHVTAEQSGVFGVWMDMVVQGYPIHEECREKSKKTPLKKNFQNKSIENLLT